MEELRKVTPHTARVFWDPAFIMLSGTAIGVLGGLIGLGGAEFRLPVLVSLLGYSTKQAVPLNLAISMVTVCAALGIRAGTLSWAGIENLLIVLLSLIIGGIVAAFAGAGLGSQFSKEQLERTVFVLLIGIGSILIIEAFISQDASGFIPDQTSWQIITGLLFGRCIGLVSSLLGVAGGELIIPTLVFAFGAGIKMAGTGSLLVSLPTVAVGLARYSMHGAFADKRSIARTLVPMSIGSIIGAIVGGVLAGVVSAAILKLLFGFILDVSALKLFLSQANKRTQ